MDAALLFTVGAVGTLCYAPIPEYILHRWVMHNPRCKVSFRRHVIDHHQATSRNKFRNPDYHYMLGFSSAIPLMLLFHMATSLWLGLFGWWLYWGSALGAACYLLFYEWLHFHIHVPRSCWFQRTRLFRFYLINHLKHHQNSRQHYGVVSIAIDLLLRTYSKVSPRHEESVAKHNLGRA